MSEYNTDDYTRTVWGDFAKDGSRYGDVEKSGWNLPTPIYPPSVPVGDIHFGQVDVIVRHASLKNEHDTPSAVGFLERKRNGLYIPPLPYASAVRWNKQRAFTPGYVTNYAAQYGLISASEFISLFQLNAAYQEANSKAISNFWASARNRQRIAGGVLLIELKETLGLVSQTILTIVEIIRALKKGRFDLAVKALLDRGDNVPSKAKFAVRNYSKQLDIDFPKWFANAWLELQFGWKPLLADIHSLSVDVTDKLNGDYFPTVSIKGHSGFVKANYSTLFNNHNVRINEGFGAVSSSVTALFRIEDSNLELLQAFGLLNPLSVAWEVVPFSFVIDWFAPIGNYLDNLGALAGLELVHITEFRKTVLSGECEMVPHGTRNANASGVADCGFVEYFRTELNEIPSDPLRVANPLDLIDGWHTLTSLALLDQFRPR